jgi:hypothetical protein
VPDGLFDRDELIDNLHAVAALLVDMDAQRAVLVVVGGSYLALHGLRDTTADVDTVTKLEQSIRDAVEAVAATRDLRPDWLNDTAHAYAPLGLTMEMCDVLYEHPRLLVVGPPADYVFLMKLYAGRAPDYDDMVALWPRCTFATANEAADRFATAYPHAPQDPYLSEYIARIAQAATRNSPS